jgi:hypothetical protein
MNRIYSVAASAALVLWSVAPAPGARKPDSPATDAKGMFQQIDEWSADVAESAFRLNELAKDGRDPDSHLEGLALVREDINRIGNELQSLDAMRSSLSPWEVKALDQALPLMHDAADNAEKAIQTFNSDRLRLWASAYVDDTAQVSKDTDQVASILRDYLRLAKTRDREERLQHSLGE